MKNRIENLGDYNTARIMLQKKNGDLSALVNEFKHIGAHEALPRQFGFGALAGALILLGGQYGLKKVSNYMKEYKRAREEKEELLKGKLEDTLVADDSPVVRDEESAD